MLKNNYNVILAIFLVFKDLPERLLVPRLTQSIHMLNKSIHNNQYFQNKYILFSDYICLLINRRVKMMQAISLYYYKEMKY